MSDVTRKTKPIICILNGSSGSNRAAAEHARLTELFARNALTADIKRSARGESLTDMARNAAKNGTNIIVAAGGDGTINAVASGLIDTDVILGVLPLGTLNHFAKDLGIPTELSDAVSNLATGMVKRVDIGSVNDRYFLNNSSLGLYPMIVREREDRQKIGHGKWRALFEATSFALMRYSPLTIALEAKAVSDRSCETSFLFIGNNKYETIGPHIGKRGELDGGRLWAYRAPHAGRAALLRLALRAFRTMHDPNELITFSATEFWVRTKKTRLLVATDGEVQTLATPLHYRILPHALGVIVPPGAATR